MKWIKSKEKRTDITVLPILPGTLILCGAMLLAFLLLLVILNVSGMIDLPHWAERIIGTAESQNDDSDTFGEAFLASLSGTEQNVDSSAVFISTDPQTLLPLLREAQTIPSYYHTCTITRRNADGNSTTRQIFRLKAPDKEHTEIFFDGQLEKAVTVNQTALSITTPDGVRLFDLTDNTVFHPEGEIGFPSYTRMLSLLDLAEAGDYKLSLSTTQDMASVRIEFTDTLSGAREVFDILPDCGLIIAASSYLPGESTPYYTLSTTSLLTEAIGFDESVFQIPTP